MDDIFNITNSTLSNCPTDVIGKEEFVSMVVPKVERILKKIFRDNPSKQRIKVYRDRISFAAPCCGDSASDSHKKRGNIILEGRFKNLYKCFNCGTCMRLSTFFQRYGETLSLKEIDYITSNMADVSSYSRAEGMDSVNYLYDVDNIEQFAFDRELFKNTLMLSDCSGVCRGHDYLVSRMQFGFDKFLYSEKVDKLFILNLAPSGNIIGMQVRRFDKKGPKYKSYSLQKIHEMFNDGVTVPDDVNSLSMLFNILLVDCTKTVTITEGPMDAFMLKNSVALCGAAKNVEFPFLQRYVFDSDKTGREHAIERLREGYSVFMWDRYLSECGLPKRKKWDFNDLVVYAAKNNIILPSIDGYFTNDELDLIYI